MNSLIKTLPNFKKFNAYIEDVKNEISPMMLSGLTDTGKIHLSYATSFYTEKPICLITYNEIQAKKLIKDLSFFTEKIVYFPKRESITYDFLAESKQTYEQRILALNKIYAKEAEVVVTTIEAVTQKIIAKDTLYKNMLNIKLGENYDLAKLKEKLVILGYERYDLVEGKGQFSIRGGIIDIAISEKEGIRIELFGDEVDSIRKFSIDTQRSTEMLQKVQISPAYELVLEQPINNICNKIIKYQNNEKVKEDVESIKNGDYINKVDKYFNAFYEKQETLLEYLGQDYIIFLDEIDRIKARLDNVRKDNENTAKAIVEKGNIIPDTLQNSKTYLEFIESIESLQTIYLEKQDIGFVDKKSMHAKRNGYSFSYREVNFFRSSMDLLLEEIQAAGKENKTVVILTKTKENAKKLEKLLAEKNIHHVMIEQGELSAGFESYDFNILTITTQELFITPKKRIRVNTEYKEGETIVFADLKEGDYIVHKNHGIGQYVGVNTITADGITKDYIKIKYRDDDYLYIPTSALDSIRKYIGAGERIPKLNRLGSKEWENAKKKVKSNLKEIAKDLVELYAKRSKLEGYAFHPDTEWQSEFEDTFPYTETLDQLRCIEEIKKDMEASRPMDRLLCGDVGYGKTEVAVRVAFKACMDQKQVAYLVPTTILANQQYETFKQRMDKFAIRVELLNRFRSKKEQETIIKKLKLGEIDIVIGTHRLLSEDVSFKNLGLLIVDEEHRFGVKDKEKIKKIKTNVDVLTMTATPIPRTLHMSVVGIRDMSVIYDPPQNRKPVQTYVLEYDEDLIKEAITKELERNGQVFYLYNNVEGIQTKANKIQKLLPEAKIAFAHGKMSGKQLEDIMLDFINQKTNVLICTTILESGIDIPNANTIIVENADRLGLAQLYQIRGRVGRSDIEAYAYITYKRDKLISEVAEKRLKAIKEFTEFGSGFKIAMRDLEIRGAGSLLGEVQHGHLDSVGYDTYCKLLNEVIKEMKGIQVKEEPEVQIDIDLSSYIPDDFIKNHSEKIEIYQNIALCRNEEDITNIIDEIIDRYGRLPQEIENLLEIARIKIKCMDKGILKVMQKGKNIVFYFSNNQINLPNLIETYKNQIKFSNAKEPYVTLKTRKGNLEEIKQFLKNC